MIINCFFLFEDGPGTYTVVQCGAAGHNIRSKPNMKGCPLGRLSKGSIIGAIEEVRGTEEDRKWEREQESKRIEGKKKQRHRETEQSYKRYMYACTTCTFLLLIFPSLYTFSHSF